MLAALLIAFTGGAGLIVQAGSKIRHISRLRKLGDLLRRLGKVLKRRQLNKKITAGVDKETKVKAEKLEGPKLTSGKPENSVGLNKKTVTIYRVNDNGFDPRISSDGSIPNITTKKGNERALFVNIDQPKRAKEFALINRNGNAKITAIEADASILEKLRSTAVHDLGPDAKLNPTAPLKVDINKAPDQFGLMVKLHL